MAGVLELRKDNKEKAEQCMLKCLQLSPHYFLAMKALAELSAFNLDY
jgi:hypothetical protein